MIDNLEDAITHAGEVASERRALTKTICPWADDGEETLNECLESAKEHELLANWLTELKSDRGLLDAIRSIVWDNSLYDGIKIDKLRRLLPVYEESEGL